MSAKKDKKEISKNFRKGNFSCNLENDLGNKSDFIKTHAGKVNTDLEILWSDIQKAKTAYSKKPKTEKKADPKTETKDK